MSKTKMLAAIMGFALLCYLSNPSAHALNADEPNALLTSLPSTEGALDVLFEEQQLGGLPHRRLLECCGCQGRSCDYLGLPFVNERWRDGGVEWFKRFVFPVTVTEPKASTEAMGAMKPLSVAGPTEVDNQRNKEFKHFSRHCY
ncbi:Uncharacterized protein Fot_35931 [Forsythia ovata]|uniref:Uncharacterized protein n=1 Tax=Forsythia ovata TaxID=205694 RepID=A0ABD1SMZ8_9LAMI